MLLGQRSGVCGVLSLLLVSGCHMDSPWGSSSSGTDYGTTAPMSTGGTGTSGTGGGTAPKPGVGGEAGTTGTDDSVVATPSVPGTLSVTAGANQTISITFASSDGLAITGFGISGSLGTLPAGWSGPGSFTCAAVSGGSGCVLTLTYAPSAADSGTLVLNYVFIDNAGEARAPGGSVSIPYVATATANNVMATTSTDGEVDAVIGGGKQSVIVNFVTDDGNAATNLTLSTNLAALPSGWSSTASGLTCAIVTSGSGCQVVLAYDPTTRGGGTLSLSYAYTDDSGAARSAMLNIPYASRSGNTIIANGSPGGQIEAIEKTGGQAVAVTFTTNEGKPATALNVTGGLKTLPAGWSSNASAFTCASVSTGNGCQLHLTYAPTALARGTLTLTYTYVDGAGAPQGGLVSLPYAASTNDNAIATPSPSGQINAVVGMGTQTLSVTFTTDDARQATALALTTDLATLPAGWSSATNPFTCSGFDSGAGCQLTLTYAPAAAAAGTLTLAYTYLNNAGGTKTGTLNVPYRATTNDNIVGTPDTSALSVVTGTSTPVSITFTTDDMNPASALNVTSDLTALPTGWSSPSSSFTCASVSVGTACQLNLTYAPLAAASGSLAIDFSYTNDAGIAKTGSTTITYVAGP